ncbi:MAG: type I-U CRISPR-associated protein Cas7 [Pirellulales bacterium]|nr:type I-U CRISPR-associated protein Cas7 [Pirellulales bacterium]
MLRNIQDAVTKQIPAIRARTRFQPMGGPGDVLYPPTYSGNGDPRHDRIIDGQTEHCVLLDSVASQANRMEEALLPYKIPKLEVTVGDYYVTSLTAPHRFTDVILRSCDGYPSDVLLDRDLREIFGYSPNSLLMGIWHSNRKGGAGVRVPRSMTSEIIGVGIADAPHVGGRLDPLPISSSSKVEIDDSVAGWKLAKKGVRPSAVLLGSAFSKQGQIQRGRGVTVKYAEQITVISLTSLRQLRLGDDVTTALAAIEVAAATLTSRAMWLRSRCELLPESTLSWEFVGGKENITCDNPDQLLADVISYVEDKRLPWHGTKTLTPSKDLVNLVAEGQAAIGSGKENG